MKYSWLSITVEEPKRKNSAEIGEYSYMMKVSESDNLIAVLNRIKGVKFASVFQTKHAAESAAAYWNMCARNNGRFLFDDNF